MKYILALIALLMFVTTIHAQAPMETKNWSDAKESLADINRFERADSTFFCFPVNSFVKSGVFQLWKYTTVSFTLSGTSPVVKARFYGGYATKKTNTTADTTKYHFVLLDSLTCTGVGEYSRQISDNLLAAPCFYMSLEKISGSNVLVTNPAAYRNRY